MKRQLPILMSLVIITFSACKKETDLESIDLGYDYFPNAIGSFIEYEVDSIHYGIEVDTTHYWLMELVAEDFFDNEGNLAMKLERYKKFAVDGDYQLTDVWVQKRTSTTAERVEENVRYVRMIFPMEEGKSWDGNAYNPIDSWNYTFTNVSEPHENGALIFSNTVRVDQRYNVNLIDQEIAWEVYARNIGLVHKKLTDLNYQDFTVTGVDMEMWAINYGVLD